MKKILLLIIFSVSFCISKAQQITGDSTVCPGNIYTYSAYYPGAASYNWILPNGWYDITGQGTSSISATCNVSKSDICVDAYDSNHVLLSSNCYNLLWGGVGGGSFIVQPQYFSGCEGSVFNITITPVAPGAGCVNYGCGSGVPHPNLGYLVYTEFTHDYRGNINQPIYAMPGSESLKIYYVDYTAGTDFSQVHLIEGGCAAGAGNNSCHTSTFAPTAPMFYQTPAIACVGDTIQLAESYTEHFTHGGWTNTFDIQLIGNYLDNPITVVTSGGNPHVDYSGIDIHNCPLSGTFYPDVSCLGTSINEDQSENDLLLVYGPGNEIRIQSKKVREVISEMFITDISGKLLINKNNTDHADLSEFENGIYFINVITTEKRNKTFKVFVNE